MVTAEEVGGNVVFMGEGEFDLGDGFFEGRGGRFHIFLDPNCNPGGVSLHSSVEAAKRRLNHTGKKNEIHHCNDRFHLRRHDCPSRTPWRHGRRSIRNELRHDEECEPRLDG